MTSSTGADWNETRLRAATKAAGVALWSWNVATDEVELDDQARQLWGHPTGEVATFAALSQRIDPDDLNRVQKEFEATRLTNGAYEIDFQIFLGSEAKWISARGQGRDAALIDEVLYAVFIDVTARKLAEEAQEILAAEMSHRVKNLFAVTLALTSVAARSTSTKEELEYDLTRRITTLGDAHDLVHRVQEGASQTKTSLASLLTVLLCPYDGGSSATGRIAIVGPIVAVGESGATALALIIHELATNSVKYGALSVPEGCLNLSLGEEGGEVIMSWTEQGGPLVADPKGRSGFGSRLLSRSLSGHLGGSIKYDWLSSGLIVTMRMNKARLEA